MQLSSTAGPSPKAPAQVPFAGTSAGEMPVGYRGRSSTSSRHRLPPLRRRTPGRNRKSTHPVSQASTKVSTTIHVGAGTAILDHVSFYNNKTNPRTGRDLGCSRRVHPVVQEDLCATIPQRQGNLETVDYTLRLRLDVIPGASVFVSLLQQPPRP